MVARWAHNPKVVGSNPTPATNKINRGENMIYVMSDIHGNMYSFRSIMKQINLQPSDTLYILGDVIDRYPYGIEILEEIMDKPNIKMLLGNHEYMMLTSISNSEGLSSKKDLCLWYRNLGKVTHDAFLELDKQKQKDIISYLKSLPINIDIMVNNKKYKLIHASVIEWYDKDYHYNYRDEIEFAVWNRIPYDYINSNDEIIVFGHTITNRLQNCKPMRIYKAKNMIGLDCGCGYQRETKDGRLACLRLDDMQEYYSK